MPIPDAFGRQSCAFYPMVFKRWNLWNPERNNQISREVKRRGSLPAGPLFPSNGGCEPPLRKWPPPDVMTLGGRVAASRATRDMVAEVEFSGVPIKVSPKNWNTNAYPRNTFASRKSSSSYSWLESLRNPTRNACCTFQSSFAFTCCRRTVLQVTKKFLFLFCCGSI